MSIQAITLCICRVCDPLRPYIRRYVGTLDDIAAERDESVSALIRNLVEQGLDYDDHSLAYRLLRVIKISLVIVATALTIARMLGWL